MPRLVSETLGEEEGEKHTVFCVLLLQELQLVHPVSALENVAMLGHIKSTSIQLLHLEDVLCYKYLFFLLILMYSTPF